MAGRKSGRKCPNCGRWGLCWDSDADAEECGYTDPGIVNFYHCTECGADIEVYVRNAKEE